MSFEWYQFALFVFCSGYVPFCTVCKLRCSHSEHICIFCLIQDCTLGVSGAVRFGTCASSFLHQYAFAKLHGASFLRFLSGATSVQALVAAKVAVECVARKGNPNF